MENLLLILKEIFDKNTRITTYILFTGLCSLVLLNEKIPAEILWVFQLATYAAGIVLIVNFILWLFKNKTMLSNLLYRLSKPSDYEVDVLQAFFDFAKDGEVNIEKFNHYDEQPAQYLEAVSNLQRHGYILQIPIIGSRLYFVTDKGINYLLKNGLAK